MKIKTILLILTLSLTVFSCKKSEVNPSSGNETPTIRTFNFNDSLFSCGKGSGWESRNGGPKKYYYSINTFQKQPGGSELFLGANFIKKDSLDDFVTRDYITVDTENISDMKYGECTVYFGDSTTKKDFNFYRLLNNQVVTIKNLDGNFQLIIDNKRAYKTSNGVTELVNLNVNLNF